jgi:hypothetical protein
MTVSKWIFDRELAACFGPGVSFAGHPLDKDHAFELLCLLRPAGIGWSELRQRILARISRCEPAHIKHQLDKAEEMFKPWLID